MALLEPIPGERAGIASLDGERALVIADYHAGIEYALRSDGVEIPSRAGERRERLLAILDRVDVDRVVFLGDLGHQISEPYGRELDELRELIESVTDRVPVLLVKGNHDGLIDDSLSLPVTDATGVRLGDVGFVHGHSWPEADVITASVVCVGHEHPVVRLEDTVGGGRKEPVWIRGPIAPDVFTARLGETESIEGELVIFPAFNEIAGSTWVNVDRQNFLSPFLPGGVTAANAYLLDGTRLGDYREV